MKMFLATTLVADGRIKTAGSLAGYVSAVRQYHTDQGYECPTPSQFGPLKRVIDGLKRSAQRPIKKSWPITPTILMNFLTTYLAPPFCPILNETLTVYKILSLLYFLTMLRCSSLIPRTFTEVDPKRLVCWGDVKNLNYHGIQGIVFHLGLTKTIQNGEREQKIPLARNDHCPILCPVRAIATLRDIIGEENIRADVPLFQARGFDKQLRPILRRPYEMWFNHRLSEMGENTDNYTLHAWRHGGIHQTLMSEHNLALAKMTSDHSSDAILEYSNVSADRRLTISQKINRNLSLAITGEALEDEFLPANVLQLA